MGVSAAPVSGSAVQLPLTDGGPQRFLRLIGLVHALRPARDHLSRVSGGGPTPALSIPVSSSLKTNAECASVLSHRSRGSNAPRLQSALDFRLWVLGWNGL